jgi:hypothetical protein
VVELEPDPLQSLIAGNRERGAAPDWRSGMPTCKRDHDVPWKLEAAAREALERESADEPAASGAA